MTVTPMPEYRVKTLKRASPGLTDQRLRLGISVGNKSHEGAKLEALIDWAGHKFGYVSLLVADSLQRHNIMAEKDIDPGQAFALSLEAGTAWMERNRCIVERLPAYKLYRFDDFRLHNDFPALYALLRGLYEKNLKFRSLIDRDTQNVYDRKQQRGGHIDREKFFRHSRDYIIEELAVMKIFHETCPGVEAYPGKFIQAITSPDRHSIDGLPEGLKTYPLIEVDFIRNKGFEPSREKHVA